MKSFVIFLCALIISACSAQETIIIDKTKIDWKDHPKVFQDSSKMNFKDGYRALEDVDYYEISYMSDGLKIQSFAAIPKKEGKHPVIIFNRGGNRDFGGLELMGGQSKYPVVYGFLKLASEGYIVIGCNYRGAGKSEGADEFGGGDVNDVLNLIKVVKELPSADSSKIGMYGWSRGGMMTYLSLIKTNDIKAAVVGGAPADKTVIDRPNMETNVYAVLIPNYWENKDEELRKRSAVFFADKFPKDVPILILHGNADWRVKSTNSLKLAMEFEKHRVPYRLKIFEGGNHGLGEFRSEVDEDVLFWFNRYLKRGEALPNMEYHGN